MEEYAVRIENLAYTYPDGTKALKDIDLTVRRGEKAVILGANGAGKSTLLLLMNGLLTPSDGTITVMGIPVEQRSFPEVHRKVGLVFQNSECQLFCPTLWEDVAFGPLNMGLPEEDVVKRTEAALKAVGLEDLKNRPPHRLSIGEKKKASLATVLAMNPEILILDEPTANLDPESRTELIRLLTKLHQTQGVTLISASQDVDIIPLIAEKAYVLDKGRIVAQSTVREVFSNEKLLEQVSLEPPSVTRLFQLLGGFGFKINPLPMTVNEALEELLQILKGQNDSK